MRNSNRAQTLSPARNYFSQNAEMKRKSHIRVKIIDQIIQKTNFRKLNKTHDDSIQKITVFEKIEIRKVETNKSISQPCCRAIQ